MMNIGTLNLVKTVFVILCRIYCALVIEQNINHLVSTENGGYLMTDIALMQLLSDNKSDLTKLSSNLALYIQLVDDYNSLCLQEVMSELLV
jgi:hypothetical protein